MLQSDDNNLEGKIVSTDSHERSSNNLKQISGTKSSEPKPVKDAIQQDDNCICLNENHLIENYLIKKLLQHLHHEYRKG